MESDEKDSLKCVFSETLAVLLLFSHFDFSVKKHNELKLTLAMKTAQYYLVLLVFLSLTVLMPSVNLGLG